MRVVVPTPQYLCPATNALRMEGVDFVTLTCSERTDYGLLFTELWSAGEPFIICEWDIVPGPGLIDKLAACPKPYCTHAYPLNRGHIATSFGIGKYVPKGEAPAEWQKTSWDRLDGQVIPHLRKLYGDPHVHEPPVAHARRVVI